MVGKLGKLNWVSTENKSAMLGWKVYAWLVNQMDPQRISSWKEWGLEMGSGKNHLEIIQKKDLKSGCHGVGKPVR